MVSDLIRSKRAIRLFSDAGVSWDVIDAIVDAGQRAHAAVDDQPWTFIVVKSRDTLAKLARCGDRTGHLEGSAFAVALVGNAGEFTPFDLGQAAAYMQIVAWDRHVASCLAPIERQERAKDLLGVPEDCMLPVVIAFGYPAAASQADDRSIRRGLDDVVRRERW